MSRKHKKLGRRVLDTRTGKFITGWLSHGQARVIRDTMNALEGAGRRFICSHKKGGASAITPWMGRRHG